MSTGIDRQEKLKELGAWLEQHQVHCIGCLGPWNKKRLYPIDATIMQQWVERVRGCDIAPEDFASVLWLEYCDDAFRATNKTICLNAKNLHLYLKQFDAARQIRFGSQKS